MLSINRESSAPVKSIENAVLAWTQELAPHGIFVTDTELKIRSWNNWLEIHSGLKESDVIGRTVAEIFPKLIRKRLAAQYKLALAGQVAVLSTSLHGLSACLCKAPLPKRPIPGCNKPLASARSCRRGHLRNDHHR